MVEKRTPKTRSKYMLTRDSKSHNFKITARKHSSVSIEPENIKNKQTETENKECISL